ALSVAELGELEVSALAVGSETAKFDLSLSFVETERGLEGSLNYNVGLFTAETMARLAGHLTTLLTAIVAAPEQRIGELPLLTAAEAAQLQSWNETATDYPAQQCVQQLFEAQVERTPAAVAVVCEAEQLTYRQL